jgi:hypothetical protein
MICGGVEERFFGIPLPFCLLFEPLAAVRHGLREILLDHVPRDAKPLADLFVSAAVAPVPDECGARFGRELGEGVLEALNTFLLSR